MLVVVDEIVMDLDLVGIVDPSAQLRDIIDRNRRAAPAFDFHICNLDIDASKDVDAALVARLRVGSDDTESGDAGAVIFVILVSVVGPASDLEEGVGGGAVAV